jgi:hypothetical protein
VEYTLAGMDVLLHRTGWSVQVPARRAAERDEEKIARWRPRFCTKALFLSVNSRPSSVFAQRR